MLSGAVYTKGHESLENTRKHEIFEAVSIRVVVRPRLSRDARRRSSPTRSDRPYEAIVGGMVRL